MIRKLAMVGMLVALVVSMLAAPAEARSTLPDLQCGRVTTDVKLRHDLTCAEGVFTEVVLDDEGTVPTPIRIDLGGHTLTVPPPGASCGIYRPGGCAVVAEGGPLTIVNGTINGNVSFPVHFGDDPPGGTLSHVTVNGNVFADSVHQEVRASTINGNISSGGDETIVDHSTIRGWLSFSAGIDSAGYARVSHNAIVGGGITLSAAITEWGVTGRITDNVITSPGRNGILLIDGEGGVDATILGNRIVGSTGNGIELVLDQYQTYRNRYTLGGNRVIGSGGHAIYLERDLYNEIIDRGTNRASGSGLLPQCVGVVCGPG